MLSQWSQLEARLSRLTLHGSKNAWQRTQARALGWWGRGKAGGTVDLSGGHRAESVLLQVPAVGDAELDLISVTSGDYAKMRAWQSGRLTALLKQPWWGQGCVPGAEGQDGGGSSLQTPTGPSLQPQNPNRALGLVTLFPRP